MKDKITQKKGKLLNNPQFPVEIKKRKELTGNETIIHKITFNNSIHYT